VDLEQPSPGLRDVNKLGWGWDRVVVGLDKPLVGSERLMIF